MGVMFTYTILAVVAYLFGPARQTTSLPFRLSFEGAAQGTYPNGRKFSPAEITDAQILFDVYNRNGLGDFIDYPTFSRSVFVLESNREYDQLVAEYQAKLSDPRLTPVDRERLSKEFEMKRASLSKSDYSINFVQRDSTKRVPPSVVEKVLRDTLSTWAEDATARKQVLKYSVPVLSGNVLETAALDTHGPIVALVMLRNRVNDLIANIHALKRIPGALIARTAKRRASLDEIQLRLEDIVRFQIEPLIVTANSGGLLRDRQGTLRVLEAQIVFDRDRLRLQRAREAAHREALLAYGRKEGPATGNGAERTRGEGDRETVMPQISDTFLERLMTLVNSDADREYRQRLVEDIRAASLDVIPAELAVAYDEHLIELVRRGGNGATVDAETFRAQWKEAVAGVTDALAEVNEIYLVASRQLNPNTELYTVPAPSTHRVERSVSWRRLGLIGIVVLLLAIPVVIGLALLHNRVREEEILETQVAMHSTAP
ncbi:MAG TPA: hypothetical protein VNL91_03695 [Thermoanaerobaculia bacterium]|nr:hypothetical protein [Thermoanaerobaculia bacterium]